MCRKGPVSSSRTGSTPNTRVYQASLTARSDTVTATWVMAGMVAELATVGLLRLVVVVDEATVRTGPSRALPRSFPRAGRKPGPEPGRRPVSGRVRCAGTAPGHGPAGARPG